MSDEETIEETTEPKVTQVEMGGRTIDFKPLSPGQLALIHRTGTKAIRAGKLDPEIEQPGTRGAVLRGIGMILDVVEANLVDPDDIDHVQDALIRGDISVEALISGVMGAGVETGEDAPDGVALGD